MRLISATSSAFDLVSPEYDTSRSDGFIGLDTIAKSGRRKGGAGIYVRESTNRAKTLKRRRKEKEPLAAFRARGSSLIPFFFCRCCCASFPLQEGFCTRIGRIGSGLGRIGLTIHARPTVSLNLFNFF
jgi:hypothetical protein